MTETLAHPVVSIIVEHPKVRGNILLQLRTKAEAPGLENLHELPQGRLRTDESITECAIRELREETGLEGFRVRADLRLCEVRSEQLTSLTAIVVGETGQHAYLAVCLVGTAEGTPRASHESSEPRWFSQPEVLELIARDQVYPLNVPMILAYYR